MEEERVVTTSGDSFCEETTPEMSDVTSGDFLAGGGAELGPIWSARGFCASRAPASSVVAWSAEELEFAVESSEYPDEEDILLARTRQVFYALQQAGSGCKVFRVLFRDAGGLVDHKTVGVRSDASVTVAPELLAESEMEGFTHDLERAVRLARGTYSSLERIDLLLEDDPEIAERRTIRLLLTVSGAPEEILEEECKFKERLGVRLNERTREMMTVTYRWE